MNRYVEPPVVGPAVRAEARAAPDAAPASTLTRRQRDDFSRAHRHSRRVRFFRVALPAGVVIVAGCALALHYLNPFSLAVDLPFELGRVSFSGTQVVMEFPKLQGFTQDNRGYKVTAESAAQDLTQPNKIDLKKINATLELADQGSARLVAQSGSYDTKTELVTLAEGVHFSTSTGYGGQLQDATIDVKGGRLSTENPVLLTYLDGSLKADRMEVWQKDARALLTGDVHLEFTLPPPDPKSGSAGPDAGAAPPQGAVVDGAP